MGCCIYVGDINRETPIVITKKREAKRLNRDRGGRREKTNQRNNTRETPRRREEDNQPPKKLEMTRNRKQVSIPIHRFFN